MMPGGKERVMEVYLGECKLRIPCYDCGNDICANHGRKLSDCPNLICPTPELDCETECVFIDEYIQHLRIYAKGEDNE